MLSSRTLLIEVPHLALVINKGAKTFLALPNTYVVIAPRIRKIALALPVVSVASWHLICLRHALSMVELLIEVDHASRKRWLVSFEVIVYKDVVVAPVPLIVFILHSAGDVCVAGIFWEWLAYSLAKLAVIIRNIVERFEPLIA